MNSDGNKEEAVIDPNPSFIKVVRNIPLDQKILLSCSVVFQPRMVYLARRGNPFFKKMAIAAATLTSAACMASYIVSADRLKNPQYYIVSADRLKNPPMD